MDYKTKLSPDNSSSFLARIRLAYRLLRDEPVIFRVGLSETTIYHHGGLNVVGSVVSDSVFLDVAVIDPDKPYEVLPLPDSDDL